MPVANEVNEVHINPHMNSIEEEQLLAKSLQQKFLEAASQSPFGTPLVQAA